MRKQRRCCPTYFALVAQWTERRSTKPEVAGSNPAWRARQVAATPASLQRAGGHLGDGRQSRRYPPADDDGDRTIANRKPALRFIRAAPSRSRPAIMEEWPSGSRHRLGKAASRQLLRGFESRFLRQGIQPVRAVAAHPRRGSSGQARHPREPVRASYRGIRASPVLTRGLQRKQSEASASR